VNATVDLHSSDVPNTEYRNHKYYLKSCCVLQDDNERDKTVFHNTIPDLQDQDHSVQMQMMLLVKFRVNSSMYKNRT